MQCLWRRWSKRKGCRMSCHVSKAAEGLDNELWRRWSDGKVGEWAELNTVLYTVEHSSFSNLSFSSPTSQLMLQPFRRFTYVTAHSPTLLSLLLRHRVFTYVTWRAAHAQYMHYNGMKYHCSLSNIPGVCCTMKQAACTLANRPHGIWNMHFQPLIPYLKILSLQSSIICIILALNIWDTLYSVQLFEQSAVI